MECWHMTGAGNDFMVLDARSLHADLSAMAVRLCAMSGADGFMAIGHAEHADFRLHFYNSDGSRAEMCGNGSRCICRFAYDHGIAGAEMTVQTDAGLVWGHRIAEDRYQVRLNAPSVLDLERLPGVAYVELGQPGVPHAVTEQPELDWSDGALLRPRAQALRAHPAFPKGANVNFYTWLDPSTVRLLTYERGVEDYTLACGTGCGSVAAVLYAQGRLPGGHLTVQNRGGTLLLQVQGNGSRADTLLLEGPAQIVRVYQID